MNESKVDRINRDVVKQLTAAQLRNLVLRLWHTTYDEEFGADTFSKLESAFIEHDFLLPDKER